MLALCKIEAVQGGVAVRDWEPRDAGPGEIRLKVGAAGICGTDMQIYNWAPRMARRMKLPRVLGHEGSGVGDQVGEGVTNVAPGDFVIIAWRAPCGTCRSCLRGTPWYCFSSRNASQPMTLADATPLSPALGIGAFAELTLVDAGQAVKVSPPASPAAAAWLARRLAVRLGPFVV